MSNSVQPNSSAALSALVWELEANAENVFGPSPIDASSSVESPARGRLYRAMTRLRTRTLPSVIASMNTSKTTFVRRSASIDDSDPLAVTQITTTEAAYAYIFGPSEGALEKGFLSVSDFEVIVAANDLPGGALSERDAVRIEGRDHDIVGIIPYPKFPAPVAYRLMVKRAAA